MTNTFQIIASSSLRSRPIWDVFSPILRSSDANIISEDSGDDTSDIAIYLPALDPLQDVVVHALIFTPSAIDEAAKQDTLSRIENFLSVHHDRGRNRHVAIFFLPTDSAGKRYTIDGFVAFQALLFEQDLDMDTPLIMLAEPDELLPSLKDQYRAVQRAVIQPIDAHLTSTSSQAQSNSTLYLLEQIVAQGPDQPGRRQNVNILSDLFPSLRALSATSRTVEGRQLISEYLGERVAGYTESFWKEERVCG